MVGRSSLATIAATLILAAPATATPVGDPVPVSFGANVDVLFNRVDGIYVASTAFSGFTAAGYTGLAVPREGPLTAVPVFGETNEPPASLAVVHNSARNEYLALIGSDVSVRGIFYASDGRRLRDVTVSDTPSEVVAAVYNPARDEFLIALKPLSPSGLGGLVVQRLDAAGARVGAANLVSDRPEVTAIRSADVAYRAHFHEYLVVWEGVRADGASDIYAQRVGADGRERGADDIRVTQHRNLLGLDANRNGVVAQGDGATALVVWSDGFEIFGRRLDGRQARPERGERQYSLTGPPDDPGYHAVTPAVAYHPREREFLVIWSATVQRIFPGGFEARPRVIFGRHLDRDARPRGPLPFEVSPADLPLPDPAGAPRLAADPRGGYLATWELSPCCSRSAIIYARRLDPLHDRHPRASTTD